MAKVNIEVTATVAKLSEFADELGYLDPIAVGAQIDGTTIMGPNPQSKQDYLAERLKAITVDSLAQVKTSVIDKEIRDQREADKAAVRDAIGNAIAVTVT